jgi:putative ABC transport system ATP-binding protein
MRDRLTIWPVIACNSIVYSGKGSNEIRQQLNRKTGPAFVFATHDPRVVSFARRVVTMRDGRLVRDRSENGVKFEIA